MPELKADIQSPENKSGYNMIEWTSPSNIALIKYWGKKEVQLPRNASLSLTLSKSMSRTRVYYKKHDSCDLAWKFLFEGKEKNSFNEKISHFLTLASSFYPELKSQELIIESSNTFPHSSGIASSASSMSALALCLLSIHEKLKASKYEPSDFWQRASGLARLGSGSASRSPIPGFGLWGKHPAVSGSSDEFAIPLPFKVHSEIAPLKDAILIVSSDKKQISSSVGHAMMETHPFAKARFEVANKNLEELLEVMKSGNRKKFISIIENEAMMLHGMMMSSDPGYFLIHPNSLKIIEQIKIFRLKTDSFITFTLDAGPNVHVLYHKKDSEQIEKFIKEKLLVFCENEKVIFDEMGKGPEKI